MTFTITLEKCFSTVITTTPQAAITYNVRDPASTHTITAFTSSYPCGSFVFTMATTPATTAITFDSVTRVVTVHTTTSVDAGTYSVTITGTLYKAGASPAVTY